MFLRFLTEMFRRDYQEKVPTGKCSVINRDEGPTTFFARANARIFGPKTMIWTKEEEEEEEEETRNKQMFLTNKCS